MAAPSTPAVGFTEDQARKLTLTMLASATVLFLLFVLAALGVFGAESRGTLMLALGAGVVGDVAFLGFIRWRRRQAIESEGMYGAAPKP